MLLNFFLDYVHVSLFCEKCKPASSQNSTTGTGCINKFTELSLKFRLLKHIIMLCHLHATVMKNILSYTVEFFIFIFLNVCSLFLPLQGSIKY